jgi:predicted transcriptional regulator
VEGSEVLEFRGLTAKERYYWIEEVLIRFRYHILKRDERGVIRQYIKKVTGYSRSQVSRLIAEYKKTGQLKKRNTETPFSVEVYLIRS